MHIYSLLLIFDICYISPISPLYRYMKFFLTDTSTIADI